MKRVGIVFAIFFIAVQAICADDFDLKYYFDFETWYNCYEKEKYCRNNDVTQDLEDLEKNSGEGLDEYEISDLLKLTKEDLWLCRSALSEYDLEDGEIYFIFWRRTPNSNSVKFLIAVIKENGKAFDYYFAKAITKKE